MSISDASVVLAIAVLCFGLLAIVTHAVVLIRRGKTFGPLSSQLSGLTIVVVAALFLAVSDIEAERAAPAYGLLGVIAGYLFGYGRRSEDGDRLAPPNK